MLSSHPATQRPQASATGNRQLSHRTPAGHLHGTPLVNALFTLLALTGMLAAADVVLVSQYPAPPESLPNNFRGVDVYGNEVSL